MKYRQEMKKILTKQAKAQKSLDEKEKEEGKKYERFACRVKNTEKKYSREVEFKRLLQFSFNSCQQAPRKREG